MKRLLCAVIVSAGLIRVGCATTPAQLQTSINGINWNQSDGLVSTLQVEGLFNQIVGVFNSGVPLSGLTGLGTGVATLLSGAASGTGGPIGSASPTISSPTITGFSANLPLIGGGAGAVVSGSRSGSTTDFATIIGSLISGHCVSIDGSGNLIDAGGACTVGGGGGTVSAGSSGNLGYYSTSGTVISPLTLGSGVLTALGVNVGSAGAPVLFNGAGGTPTSLTLTNATGLPISTGLSGLGPGVATLLGGTASGTGGPLGSASPTITGALTYGGVTLASSVTGTGSMVLSASPTLTGVTQFGGFTASPDAYSIYSAPTSVGAGSFSNPAWFFSDLATTGFNFSDASTHFAMALTGNSPTTGTGSYEALIVAQNCTNRDSSAFCTGGQENAIQVLGSTNLGNYTGNNPTVTIPASGGANSVTGEEVNLFVNAAVSAKEGYRIADLSSVAAGCSTAVCAAIDIVKASTAAGWSYGIRFDADATGTDSGFPVANGGSIITAATTTLQLGFGIDFTGMAGGFTVFAIGLPAGHGGIGWGTTGAGGEILSNTAANGGALVFASNLTALQFASANVFAVNNSGEVIMPSLPTSAGSGGLYACVDSSGNLYKKSSCP